MARVEDKFVQAGKYRTHYLEAGSGDPLLLLHPACPGAHASTEYRHNIGPLSEHFRVLAPDLIGFGQTDPPSEFLEHRYYVEHILQFMDAVGATPANVVGNCRGGLISISLAGEHPEKVKRLVLIGNAGGGVPPELHEKALAAYANYVAEPENLKKSLARCYFDSEKNVSQEAFDALFESSVRQYDNYAKIGCYPMDVPNLKPLLAEMKVPTMFIVGREDKVLTFEQAIKGYSMTPGARMYAIGNCGLHPQSEHPEEFNRVVLAFFKGELFDAEEAPLVAAAAS